MLAPTRPVFRRLTFIFVLVLFLLAFVGIQTHLAAQEQAPAIQETDNGELTTVQRKFLEDVLPPENLSPMTATQCVFGMAGIYPCNNIDLMSFLPLTSIGGGNGNDSWGWTDPTTGKEYAIMGRTSGSAYVDITDQKTRFTWVICPLTHPTAVGATSRSMPTTPSSSVKPRATVCRCLT